MDSWTMFIWITAKSVALLIWYFQYTSNFLPTACVDSLKFYKLMGWKDAVTNGKSQLLLKTSH